MESIRRSEKARINELIRTNSSYISNAEKNLQRLRTMKSSDEYVRKQIEKVSQSIEELNSKVEELNDRIIRLDNGELDNELQSNIKKATMTAKIKASQKFAEKEQKRLDKEEDSKISKEYYEKEKRNDRSGNWYGAQKFFFRTCENIPDYMIQKLSKMPVNEGHIWKGIHCYGERPNNGNGKLTMYERTYEGEQLTHEWDKDNYFLYKKDQNTRRNELVKVTPRKRML